MERLLCTPRALPVLRLPIVSLPGLGFGSKGGGNGLGSFGGINFLCYIIVTRDVALECHTIIMYSESLVQDAKQWGRARAELAIYLASLGDKIRSLQNMESQAQIAYLSGGIFADYIYTRANLRKKISALCSQLLDVIGAEDNAFTSYLLGVSSIDTADEFDKNVERDYDRIKLIGG